MIKFNYFDIIPQNCDTSCKKTELLETNFDSAKMTHSRYIPIFISSIHQKMTGIVTHFIKNPNSDIEAEEYYIGVNFGLNGGATIEGIVWTENCDSFNEKLSINSLTGETVNDEEFLRHISKTVLTTSDVHELKCLLNLTENEASSLSNSVKKYQIQSKEQPIHEINLPSLNYYRTKKPKQDQLSNLDASEKFIFLLQNILHATSKEDISSSSSIQWLNKIESQFVINADEEILNIQFDNENIFFERDDRMNDLIQQYQEFKGIYHYALTCSRIENTVILKRKVLLEVYTIPYNPQLMKIFNQRLEITPVYSYNQWDIFQQQVEETSPNLENTAISHFLANHRLISTVEMISLCDTAKIKDLQSTAIEFIATYINLRAKFKKTAVRDEETFKTNNDPDLYTRLSSNVLRHNSRIIGKELLLVETALFYEVLSKKDSTEVYHLYIDKLDKIPNSEISSIYGENKMPKYVLCDKERVLRIRSKMKVLEIPRFPFESVEYKYGMVLLYFPLTPGSTIDLERLGKLIPNQVLF